ncbi:MAG TPA: carboxypeptidase regulatory-like domain-containing protein [Candidatus Angelobacter sp.]|nr:carboxypeptidase regulatory-like domain-containing protein [Candidatus Angelobacter sp.]
MNIKQHGPVVRLVVAIVFLAPLLPLSSAAQVLKGSISGTVVDPQGAVVSQATVRATNSATGAVLATTTDSSGSFRFNLIPVGEYKVEITAQGFRTATQNQILVAAGRDSGLGSLALTVGEVTTAVEVTSAAPLIETTQSQVTNTFAGTQLTTFAGVTENQGLDNLALFVPGVAAARDNGFSNTNGGTGLSVNGLRGRNNDQQIDGQNNNDNSVGGPGLFVSDTEFVQQYVLVTSQFGPEYGRNAGSVVNVITKAGSNGWHGSVYEHENNTWLNSMTNFQRRFATDANGNPLKSIPRANDEFGGFTIGGPLVKSKLFIFGGFDQQIISQSTLYTSAGSTPTPAGLATLAACFPGSQSLTALRSFGPYAISSGNPTPFGTFLNNNPACPGVELGGVERTLPTHTHNFNWVSRLDWQLGNDVIVARYLFNRGNNFNLDPVPGDAADGYPVSVPALSQAILLGDTHTFSRHVVNDVRVGFNRLNVTFATNTLGTVPSDVNIGQAITRVTFSDPTLQPFGLNGAFPEGRIVNTWQGQDNLNWVFGKHTFKAGVNYTYQRSPNTFLPNLNGAFRFRDWESFAANRPNRVRIAAGTPTLDFREHDTFLYAGDDWKIATNLTLNLGLTWTYYGQPANLFNDLTTQRENNPATALWRQDIPLSARIFPKLDAPKTSFGPSLGFAYTPQWGGFLTGHGKTVFRGGYRLLYDPPFYNIYLNIANSAPVVFLNSFTGAQITPSMILPAHPFGPDVRAELSPQLQRLAFDPRSNVETTVSNNFGPDKVNSWSFGFEREITKNSALEVRYVGNHAYNLFQTVNGNPIVTGNSTAPAGLTGCTTSQILLGPGQTVNPALGRADCSKGIVLERNNGGFSNYHGLQTEFRANNLFHQVTLRAAYTYSRTLDNVSEIFSTGVGGTTLAFAQNPWNPGRGEYSFSGLDYPNQFSIAATEQLPFFKGQRGLVGHLLGGWTISANYLWASGQRYTPLQSQAEAALTANSNNYDLAWLAANVGVDLARPFVGSLSAPAASVGIFAGDACNLYGSACGLSANQLIVFDQNVQAGTAPGTAVQQSAVRYIVNASVAQSIFGTPFGARRNLSQDAPTNIANLGLFKNIKLKERATLEFNATLQNVFNHSNFQSIDPTLENVGIPTNLLAPGVGFADPSVTNDVIGNALGNRIVRFGLTFRF